MKRFEVMGVVKGSHYELSHTYVNEDIDTEAKATNIMLGLKRSFNSLTYYITASIGDSVDVIRTDTIEKMYVKISKF